MQLIMDNMLKTSNDIYKLMLGMKPEVFSDKMRNEIGIINYFLHKWIQYHIV